MNAPAPRRPWWLFSLPAILFCVAIWLWRTPAPQPPPDGAAPAAVHGYAFEVPAAPPPSKSPPTPSPARPPFATPDRPAVSPLALPKDRRPEDRSPLADRLNLPDTTAAQDLAIVYDLFNHYRGACGSFPTGEDNATIVNALTGNNPRRLAFIEREHPAINAAGELTDRWHHPLFFHLQSRHSIEIRSAGPDGEFYTPDDLTHATPDAVTEK